MDARTAQALSEIAAARETYGESEIAMERQPTEAGFWQSTLSGRLRKSYPTKWELMRRDLEQMRARVEQLQAKLQQATDEMLGMARTPIDPPVKCSGCNQPLANEMEFADHFRLPDTLYRNLGFCPHMVRE